MKHHTRLQVGQPGAAAELGGIHVDDYDGSLAKPANAQCYDVISLTFRWITQKMIAEAREWRPVGRRVFELNPAHVAGQRRVQGRRRNETDALDLEAITEFVLSSRGIPSRRGRRSPVSLVHGRHMGPAGSVRGRRRTTRTH